ncbi:MAG: xanthine dehydrogenase family protein molybdopterin-binding subunit [Chloroflexi bacterium]|nr:xanthine dehydrogenase family protein molybdopterin-binding subunit [Chloroflexota bacterium]
MSGEGEEYSVIGKRFPRIDGLVKVKGEARYTGDILLPGMLEGRVLRSPHPHARILDIDTSRAERLPGVRAIVTGKDAPTKNWGFRLGDSHTLCAEKARYVGDEVAAVAAVDGDVAQEAIDLIRVDYEELPAVFDVEEAMRPGAPGIHDRVIFPDGCEREVQNNTPFVARLERGDVEEGFSKSDFVLEERFVTHPVHQCYLDPTTAVASYDSSGKLTLYTSSMHPSGLRLQLAKALGMGEGKIRIVQYFVGGAFGQKTTLQPSHVICALLAKKAGKPVQLALSREEEFMAGRPRLPSIVRVKMGINRDGTIAAKDVLILNDAGAYTDSGYTTTITTIMTFRSDGVYRFSNLRAEARCVYTNKTPGGAFRGFGNPQMTFAIESMMDMAAEKIGMDRTELRMKNAARAGDVNVHGWKIDSCGLLESIEKAAHGIGWKEKTAKKRAGRGVGMACVVHEVDGRNSDAYGGSTAYVKILEDGRVRIISGEPEYGQGSDTTFAMIAAETMGIDLENIEVWPRDTDAIPYSLGPYGSRVTFAGGMAVRLAAEDAKNQLCQLAADMLEASPKDLEVRANKIYVRGSPQRMVAIPAVAKIAMYRRAEAMGEGGAAIVGKGITEPDTANVWTHGLSGNMCSAYSYGVQAVEVDVDRATGQVKVVQVVEADDCGKVINLNGAEGQVQGGLVQGLGFGLTEEIVREEGRVFNPSFCQYGILTAIDIPPIQVHFADSIDPHGPFGAKGVAETAVNVSAAAIANAVYDAIGTRIKSLPLTPEKILDSI